MFIMTRLQSSLISGMQNILNDHKMMSFVEKDMA